MPGRVEIAPRPKAAYRPTERGAMRILVLADLSGRANRGLLEHGAGLAERPLAPVDVDTFDDLLFRIAPRLHLPAGDPAGPGMALDFKRLDDFHPDSVYESLELFQALRRRRERLLDPSTFREEAKELGRWAAEKPPGDPTGAQPGPAGPPVEEDAATLERLLGRTPTDASAPGPRPATGPLEATRIIERIVRPYIVTGADPQQAQLVSAVDAGIGDQMRAILRHPAFQELESAWRAVHELVSGLQTGEKLKIYLLDVSKAELVADAAAAAGRDLPTSGLHRALVERGVRTLGGEPWSLLVGNYTFGPEPADVGLLESLGVLASHAGGPFLAAASPRTLGCRSLAEAPDPADWKRDAEVERRWAALRGSPAANWVGLALPRLLQRLPYGKKTDEIDRFEFEEMGGTPEHEGYLWGNPACACARLIALAFQDRGWSMQPGDYLDIEDLPAHVYKEGGDSRMTACAETYLSERAGEAILDRGIMPLLSYRNRNAARLMRFQSLADPPAALAGPWI